MEGGWLGPVNVDKPRRGTGVDYLQLIHFSIAVEKYPRALRFATPVEYNVGTSAGRRRLLRPLVSLGLFASSYRVLVSSFAGSQVPLMGSLEGSEVWTQQKEYLAPISSVLVPRVRHWLLRRGGGTDDHCSNMGTTC